MSEMILKNNAVLVNDSKESKLSVNKKQVIKRLNNKLEIAKCAFLKQMLDEKNIVYDGSIADVYELLKSIKEKTNAKEYDEITKRLDTMVKELDIASNMLKKGSTTAFTKFVNVGYKGVIAPLASGASISLTGSTAAILTSPMPGKLAIGVTLAAKSVYKIVKNDKVRKIADKMYELNKILQELEIIKNSEGEVVDTRFSTDIQNVIKSYLNSKKIVFEDTGYLSLREAIYNLDIEDKESLANLINNNLGNKLDVKDRIERYEDSFFGILKANYVNSALKDGAIDSTLLSEPLNIGILSTFLSNASNSKALSWAVSSCSTLGSFLVERLSQVGSVFETLFYAENLAILVVFGAGIGVVGAATKRIVDVIKNKNNKFQTQKERKKIMELDSEMYADDNIAEINKMQEYLSNNSSSVETTILELTLEYMELLGVKIDFKPRNINELENYLKKFENKNKNKVYSFLEELKEYNNKDSDKFETTIREVGRVVMDVAVYGLSGLSIYDIITSGVFLNDLNL